MLLKNVRVGERYMAVRYYRPRDFADVVKEDGALADRAALREVETAYTSSFCAEVVEVGVQVGGYARPGVLVREVNRETGELLPDHDAFGLLAVNLIAPWDRFVVAYHELAERVQEETVRRREEREREQARQQEARAKDWMERVHEQARRDIADVLKVVQPPQVLDGGAGALARDPMESEVQALVNLRYPDGNPYLNGERTA